MENGHLTLLGRKKLQTQGCTAQGQVIRTKTLWWYKVNTKPVRLHMGDGARFPHSVQFRYQIDGQDYVGRDIVSWSHRCPAVGERVELHYDPRQPGRCVLRTAHTLGE